MQSAGCREGQGEFRETKTSEMRRLGETELSWEQLDRQDWRLWILAIVLIVVLGISSLSFMFPIAFWFGERFASITAQRAFVGLCVILGLTLVYLLERQAVIRHLRRSLYDAQTAVAEAERETVCQTFLALPGMDQFRDALAMEYRRASTSRTALAAVLLTAPTARTETLGRLATHLRYMLRRGENLYRICDNALGMTLPGMAPGDLEAFKARVEMMSGIPNHKLKISTAAYPDQSASLTDMEERLSSGGTRLHHYAIEPAPPLPAPPPPDLFAGAKALPTNHSRPTTIPRRDGNRDPLR